MTPVELMDWLADMIREMVASAGVEFALREPLLAAAAAADPRWGELKHHVDPRHRLPADLLPVARSVLSFFLPFTPEVPAANARDKEQVAREWVVAYVETNALIDRITARLVELLAEQGVRAAAEPATYNFDEETLTSHWSHKSAAVISGLGSFGLHHLIITDAGCAGRLGSLVLDHELPVNPAEHQERCLYFYDGSCLECVMACPEAALDADNSIDKRPCWDRCQVNGELWTHLGAADVCGKCSVGPCALESAV